MSAPTVTLVIPTLDAATHLPACLDSVAELDYGAGRVEVVVVDNGSPEASRALLAERYPSVRVLRQAENLGFAEAVNVGARAATSDLLAFANDDMRFDPAWLRELVAEYSPADGFPCVAGLILDWDGERVDFVDGFVNFHGAAGQLAFGDPIEGVDLEDGRELPFACGGSMLVGRDVFLGLGGFDPVFFAFLEDVDLGWRLRLAGHKVRLAPAARSYHRHHGTAGALSSSERLFLYERNALRMLFKNLDTGNLARVLAPSLLLLVQRSTLDDEDAPLRAVGDVLQGLEELLAERERVQRLRRLSDEEIFARFGRPFFPISHDAGYLEAAARLRQLFRLDELFAEPNLAGGAAAAEDVETLLARWRAEYGVGRPPWWHLRRALVESLPEPARRRLRALAGRS